MTRPIATVTFDGRPYRLQGWGEEDLIYRGLVLTGAFYEEPTLRRIRDMSIEGAYVDVGANIGNHAVFFAQECSASRVLMFEAVAELCEIARANMAANALRPVAWEITHAAVSDSPVSEVGIWVSSALNMGRSKIDEGSAHRVRNVRLDDAFAGVKERIGLIKIDVEGVEIEVVRGGLATIATHRPVIAAETFGGYGRTAVVERDAITALLRPLGYGDPMPSFTGDIPFYFWTAL